MGVVAGFKAELEEAAGHGHVGVGQVVLHADYVGPHAGDDLAHAGQLAGLILQGNHQIGLAAAHDHAAGNHAGKDVYIDIAAGDQADGLFALDGQLAEQRGGNRRGTGTFGHQLLVFHQGQDGGSNLILADRHDAVHILFDHLKGGFAGGLYRNAVRKGIHMVQRFIRMVAVRIVHAGGTGSLNAVNLDIGAQALDGKGHTGQQAAAAHGHHNSFHIGQLIQNFQAKGTLPGNAQLIIKEITLKWEDELQRGMKEKDDALTRLQAEQQQLKLRVDELETFLQNSRNTLQGWLKDNKPGWEENIGKLCDESILWQTGLSPQLHDNGESFYGISINLAGIERHIKSINDYQKEKETGTHRLEEIASEITRLQIAKEELEEALKNKYQPKIKEQKDVISVQEYELGKLEQQYQQDMLDLEDWKNKAEAERERKMHELENQKAQAHSELKQIEAKLNNLNKEKAEKLNTLKQEWSGLQHNLANEKKKQADTIQQEEQEEQKRIASVKADYENDMQKELHKQVADTERLQDIAKQLQDIEQELLFIKDHATLLIEYQKDKRDLINHIPEWKREYEEQKRLLDNEKENVRKEINSLQGEIDKLSKSVNEAEENVRTFSNNLEAYERISVYEWYKPHQDIFRLEKCPDTGLTVQKSCMELINELGRMQSQYTESQSSLRKEVNLFTGHFGEDNTFKFKTKFNEDWEYIRFAEELHDFVEENKISQFIRRINNEHSDIFKRISMDTSMLTASESDIHDLINKVNKGFQTCNFVGVIQRIEMKVEESSNRVVNSLRAIQKYYNEHAYDLAPGTNLFSSENEQLVKQEAIALLRDFIKEMHAYRYDKIRLYDSFELRFRIVENNNDTGFVEKLSNVGSEGTDILVKAMINIMLLYVFKESASQKFKDFKLHCMMDEIGKLHPNNVNGILKFANDRNIILINGSPTELNRDAYKHVYLLTKGAQSKTRIARLISDKKL